MVKQDNISSDLKILDFYFSDIIFNNERKFGGGDVDITYNIANAKLPDGKVQVVLTVVASGQEQGLYLKVSAVGIFDATTVHDEKQKEFMEQIATVTAIMPYLRSQVAILTTQPGISQLLLPPIDVYKLVSEQNKN